MNGVPLPAQKRRLASAIWGPRRPGAYRTSRSRVSHMPAIPSTTQ